MDVGAGTTDMAVISLSGISSSRTVQLDVYKRQQQVLMNPMNLEMVLQMRKIRLVPVIKA